MIVYWIRRTPCQRKKYELFELKQDLGTIEWASGDASGGQFNGLYRAFEVIYKRKHS